MAEGSNDKRLLYIAILLGALSSIVIYFYISGIKAEAEAGGKTRFALMSRDMRYGSVLSKREVRPVTLPDKVADLVKRRYMTWSEFEKSTDRIVQRDLERGELLKPTDVGESALDFDARHLSENERFLSISVDEITSGGYRLHKNDRVDVYVTDREEGTRLLQENVRVVAIGTGTTGSRGSDSVTRYRSIGIILDKTEVEKFISAVNTGNRFSIVIKNPGE